MTSYLGPTSPSLNLIIPQPHALVTDQTGSFTPVSPSTPTLKTAHLFDRVCNPPARPDCSRRASFLRRLELQSAQQRELFGLAGLTVSVSPDSDHFVSPQADHIPVLLTMSDMSKSDTLRPNPTIDVSPGASSTDSQTPTTSFPVPSSSRIRQPAPPSPLSRIQAPGAPSQGDASTTPLSQLSPPHNKSSIPQTSPCFIHSHLDRHGSLQDWLGSRGTGQGTHTSASTPHPHRPHLHNGPTPVRAMPQHLSRHAHHSHAHSSRPNNHPAKPTSPILNGRSERSPGYDSDRSSQAGGSAILDGDLVDDDEEGGSLTKQLAETAQGVREMSKELGRTRVRSRIQHVLIVTKARDNRLIKLTRELALYLMNKKPASSTDNPPRPGSSERGMVVYVDAQLRSSKRFDAAGLAKDHPQLFEPVGRRRSSSTTSVNTLSAYPSSVSLSEAGKRKDEGQLRYWTSEMCSNSPQLFDFVITLGGDGTVLFTSWLFQRIVPPVLPFALGSLGFLTNFDFAKYKPTMDKVIDDGIRVNLRMRFTCTVYRAIAPEEANQSSKDGKRRKAIKKPGGEILMSQVDRSGWEALEGSSQRDEDDVTLGGKDKEIMCFSTRAVEQFEVLNDLVVDRGPSPFVSLLELFGDEHHLTTVQADGLTVSTPTGSTAYSLSAGGSLVHPQIPALLITPICPHTLSFRPMLLPDSMELRICVPYNSRSTAWASFDGRGRVELKQGDHIKVTASKYPFPTVCADKASTDWFSSISRTLRWNEREKQKSFVVVEEDNEPAKNNPKRSGQKASESARQDAPEPHQEEEEDEEKDEDDEEEEFDIDDKSGGENTNPSSPQNHPVDPRIPLLSRLDYAPHKSGVDTPDRFVTPYSAPPQLSQRHLVEALAAAEIDSRDGEVGQRDHIRGEMGNMRVDGVHAIPTGRGSVTHETAHSSSSPNTQHRGARTPRPHAGRSVSDLSVQASRPGKRKEEICKAKAFAFFGQDDSASDMSDETSEC